MCRARWCVGSSTKRTLVLLIMRTTTHVYSTNDNTIERTNWNRPKANSALLSSEIGETSAMRDGVLGDQAREGHHREAGMLDLRETEAFGILGVLAESSI